MPVLFLLLFLLPRKLPHFGGLTRLPHGQGGQPLSDEQRTDLTTLSRELQCFPKGELGRSTGCRIFWRGLTKLITPSQLPHPSQSSSNRWMAPLTPAPLTPRTSDTPLTPVARPTPLPAPHPARSRSFDGETLGLHRSNLNRKMRQLGMPVR